MRNERIINLILKEQNYITANQISEKMGISRKLIIQSIQEIKEELPAYGAQLEVKKGLGYHILIHDKSNFDAHFKIPLTQNMITTHTSDSHSERVIFLCRKLLSQERPITISSLASQLYLSKSAIEDDLKQVYELLSDYQLSVEAWKNKGLIVVGEEKNKRIAITDLIGLYYNFYLLKEVDTDYWRWIACENDEATKIRHIIYDVLQNCHVQIKDISVQRITAYLIVMRHRCLAWYPLFLTEKEKRQMGNWPQIKLVEHLFYCLEKENSDFYVAEDEKWVVAQLFYVSQEMSENAAFVYSQELMNKRELIMNEVEKYAELNFPNLMRKGETLRKAVKRLIDKALFRKQWNLPETCHFINQSTDIAILNSPVCYYIARKLASQIENEIQYQISVEEITKLAQVIYNECERLKIPHRKLKMLTYCENGLDMAALMIERWNRYFGEFIESNQPVELYEVRKLAAQDYDCILILALDFAYKETIPPFFTSFIPNDDVIQQFIDQHILACYELEAALPQQDQITLHEHKTFKNESQFIHQLANKVCSQTRQSQQLEQQLKEDFLTPFLILNEEVILLFGDYAIVKKEVFQIHQFKHAVRWKGRTVKTLCFAVLSFENLPKLKILEILYRKLGCGRIVLRQPIKDKNRIEAMNQAIKQELKLKLISR